MQKIEGKTTPYRKKYKVLKDDSSEYRTHWREIVEYLCPRRGRYLTSDDELPNDGKKKHGKIINGASNEALRILAAGMHSDMTSPSRPWLSLNLDDESLMEIASVREWLHDARNILLAIFAKSNFYNAMHSCYKELGAFGINAIIIEEDFNTVVRFVPLTIGEFRITLDSRLRPNGIYRTLPMTARQMVEEFGKDKVSQRVKECVERGNTEVIFFVTHVIEKNSAYDPNKKDNVKGKLFKSLYYENACDNEDAFLRESGFSEQPFVAPRWEVVAGDIYGECPAMDALADIKMLQTMEEKKLKALNKMVDPPMNAPSSMKDKGGVTIVAGGVNYSENTSGNNAVTPTYLVRPDLQDMAYETDRVEKRIKRFFYSDLFLALIGETKTMTATEVAKRLEEKLLMLGPVVERIQQELLEPIVDRVFAIASRLEIIPLAPQELLGKNVKVNYISRLAQAQKVVGISPINEIANFVAGLAQIVPSVVDKFDADECVDQFLDAVGAPPKVIRTDDEVAKMREVQAAQQAQAAQMQSNMAMSQMVKNMSAAKMGEGNALDKYMESTGQA